MSISHYEIKITLVVDCENENTATVQRALVDYLNYMQRHQVILTTTEDDEQITVRSWEPINDESV